MCGCVIFTLVVSYLTFLCFSLVGYVALRTLPQHWSDKKGLFYCSYMPVQGHSHYAHKLGYVLEVTLATSLFLPTTCTVCSNHMQLQFMGELLYLTVLIVYTACISEEVFSLLGPSLGTSLGCSFAHSIIANPDTLVTSALWQYSVHCSSVPVFLYMYTS